MAMAATHMKIRDLLEQHPHWRRLCLLLSGALMCLTLIFPVIGFLEWIAMIPAACVLLSMARDTTVRYRRLYLYGFLYFMGFFLTAFHWFLALYPLDFIDGISKGDAVLIVMVAWIGVSLLQAVVAAWIPVLLALFARRGLGCRVPTLIPWAGAALFTIGEWVQTLTWAGVPWARLAIGQTSSPVMIQTASLFGSYFITFLLTAVNFLFAFALLSDTPMRRKIYALTGAGLIACNAFAGAILLIANPAMSDKEKKYTAAAIQPNISSHEKWGVESVRISMERLEKYSLAAAEQGAKLIVWSETAFASDVLDDESLCQFISDLAVRCKATIVVGAFSQGEKLNRNSLLFVNPDGSFRSEIYSKRHLVPFGEYVPWRAFFSAVIPQLTEIAMLEEDLEPGTDSALAYTEAGVLGGLICFDSIYETLSLDSARDGAEVMILSTNDSWFLDSAAVYMHNCQAKLRAVETGKYLVRSANTGISSIIDANGRLLAMKEPLVEGYITAEICPKTGQTLYTKIGNTAVYLMIAFCLLLGLSSVFHKTANRWMDNIPKAMKNTKTT